MRASLLDPTLPASSVRHHGNNRLYNGTLEQWGREKARNREREREREREICTSLSLPSVSPFFPTLAPLTLLSSTRTHTHTHTHTNTHTTTSHHSFYSIDRYLENMCHATILSSVNLQHIPHRLLTLLWRNCLFIEYDPHSEWTFVLLW